MARKIKNHQKGKRKENKRKKKKKKKQSNGEYHPPAGRGWDPAILERLSIPAQLDGDEEDQKDNTPKENRRHEESKKRARQECYAQWIWG